MKKRDRTKNREEGKLEDERLYNKEKIRKGNTQKVKLKRKNTKEKATKGKTILRGFYYLCLFL